MDTGLVVPFGRYVLKERLAQGGMGEVFRAVAVGEHGFEKPVVVKRILPAHAGREDLTELFVAEAKLMTKLAHPNIVEVLDFGRGEHKDYYLVLELVDGADLGRLLRAESARGTPFPVPLALFIASQVLRGLHHAHTKSAGEGAVIVHRDVSPSNVLCSLEGEVKVADFGVALVRPIEEAGEGSGRGGVAGKPGYMAPEQFDGGAVDPRADVFSAAVVLHQMLTGELPFGGPTVEAQQEAARRGDRARVPDRRPEVSEAVEAILARAMAVRAEERFPDARAMAQAIEALRDGGQRIATGDDLAEAVRAAQRDLPAAGRKVIALTGPSAAPVSSEDAPRELTRTGAPGAVGAFTLRFPIRADATTKQREPEGDAGPRSADRWNAPEPRTERIASEERPGGEPWALPPSAPGEMLPGSVSQTLPAAGPSLPFPVEPGTGSGSVPQPVERPEPPASDKEPSGAPRPKTHRRTALAAVAAAALLLVIAYAVRPSPAVPPAAPAAATSPVPAEPTPSAAPSARSEVEAPSTAEPPASAPPTTSAATVAKPSLRSAPAKTAAPAPTATATAAASAPAVADCAGDVSFHSNGAWRISGGPKAVESPARLSWPCGSYTVVATSRMDATQVQTRTFTVGPMRSTVVDLR